MPLNNKDDKRSAFNRGTSLLIRDNATFRSYIWQCLLENWIFLKWRCFVTKLGKKVDMLWHFYSKWGRQIPQSMTFFSQNDVKKSDIQWHFMPRCDVCCVVISWENVMKDNLTGCHVVCDDFKVVMTCMMIWQSVMICMMIWLAVMIYVMTWPAVMVCMMIWQTVMSCMIWRLSYVWWPR